MTDEFKMRLNEKRKYLIERAEKKIGPEIDKTSKTAAIEKAIEKGLEWFEMREEELERIEEEQEDLESQKESWKV